MLGSGQTPEVVGKCLAGAAQNQKNDTFTEVVIKSINTGERSKNYIS